MLNEIEETLAMLDKVQVQGGQSVKALSIAIARLEKLREKIRQGREAGEK